MLHSTGIPVCEKCGGRVKPDVVLYEEGLDSQVIDGAVRAIRAADVLIIGGTSLVVYPAAGLIDYFQGSSLVLINKSETAADRQADLVIHDLRKLIIFSPHNVFQDPPFGRLDLISCRNLLIYFQPILQKDLFGIFHMALKDGGFLFLGKSEAINNTYDEVFMPVWWANIILSVWPASR